MTVLNTESRLVGGSLAEMPRVNLLPPEIAEKAAFRKIQMGLGAAVAGAVAVVALLAVSASHGVSTAQKSLDDENQKGLALQKQVTALQSVSSAYAAADAAQAQLSTAMGEEVRYSRMMNDLSLIIPSNVWLKSVSFVQVPSSAPAAAGAGAQATSIGSVTFQGVGFSHDDLAVWLDSLGTLKTYSNPYFSNSTEALLGAKSTVTFSVTAQMTPNSFSNRFNKPLGD